MTNRPAYSPWEPAFGWSEILARPVMSASHRSSSAKSCWYPGVWLIGAKGWIPPKPFQLTPTISAVALSFMVQEPSGIIADVRDRSFASSRRM